MKLSCPSCGSPLEFRFDDSFVRVCGACHSAIVRTDRGIDSLGQFADLGPAGSGLRLGDAGRWRGQGFVLVGRAEYQHAAGGSWEEWYLKLADGRWAWLSHAHGHWGITFRGARSLDELPSFEQIAPGMVLRLGAEPGVALTVGERDTASLRSAEGELPFAVVPGTPSRFVDASDARGRVATIDFGPDGREEPPVLYLGQRATLDELGLRAAAAPELEGPARVGERLACPNCGGSIELRVPGSSLSVACPYCGSLLDCEGPLSILARLGEVEAGRPDIPLGAVGTFEGTRYTVTGRLRRRASFDGGFVEWDEYLLHEARAGYRWLVCAQGHYSFVTPLAPGAVVDADAIARYRGVPFRIFDRGRAEVNGVWGEFYWKVSVGEAVETADYIAPPAMLSRESSGTELHWSLGVYQPLGAVRRAFELPALRDVQSGVAPNQPFVHRHWLLAAALLAALLLVCVVLRLALADAWPVYSARFHPGRDGASAGGSQTPPGSPYVLFSEPFELRARQNVQVELSMPLVNDWAYATVDLVNEESGEMRSYGAELSHYSGVEGGERWSEGSTTDRHLFGAGRAGSHVLRVELQTPSRPNAQLTVAVVQNVFAWTQLAWVVALLGVPAALLGLYHYHFERRRWSESDFAPSSYAASSDD